MDENRREQFSALLKNGGDVEEARAAALEYLDDKISETMYVIDFAWGPELQMACIMQERYKAKKSAVEDATTVRQIVSIVG